MAQFTPGTPRIAFDDIGRGDTALLFMPGWCANRTVFRPLLHSVGKKTRAIALDWRGHGESASVEDEFGSAELVADALSVIDTAGVERVIPVALAHSGWIAFDLARRLGERVPRIVLLDWIVTPAPPPFLNALAGMQDPAAWRNVVDGVFDMWLAGISNAALTSFVRGEMGSYGFPMWSRAAREIASAYAEHGSPLAVLARENRRPVLHLFADSYPAAFVDAHRAFAKEHPWFAFEALPAKSHFPMFEVPERIVSAIHAHAS